MVSDTPMASVMDRLRLLLTRRGDTWWDIGMILDEIATHSLAGLSFDRFVAIAEIDLGLSKSDAWRYRRVAHKFSRETAMRFGPFRLDLLLEYLDIAPSAGCVVDVLHVDIVTGDDGRVVPFSEISEEELVDAIQFVREQQATGHPYIPQEVEAARERLAAALSEVAPEVRVKIHTEMADGPDDLSLMLVGINPSNAVAVGNALVVEGEIMANEAMM